MTSVTIEQRLREMEAVHSMLRVAMADDGDEDDETKEEYGKKVDETLATLRARLEDARRSEGKIDLENTENASDDPSIATSNPSDQIDRTHRYGSSDLDQAKDRELSHQREVIESLQKEVLQLHESKDQELESVKIDLSQAHDATVLKLRQECEETISRHSEHTTAKLKNAEESYNALLKEQQGSNETQLRELRATVASLDETNAELRRSISDLQSAKIKEFESRLASSAEEIKELKSSQAEAGREADLVRERMATLEVERDQAQASKLAMDEALSRALDEGLSFKNALETLEKEGKDAALQHQVQLTQAKEEVTATSKALEENMRQSELSTTDHLAELQDLRNSHQTTIEEHAKKSQSDLAEWQSKYNTLLEETESAAKHHFDDIEALKSEKAHLITSKDLELEEIKMSHNKEIDALKERIQSHESQSWSDQETRKKLEEDMAIVQQRQETECRLTREECDATISQKAQEAEKLCEQAEESIQNLKSQLEVAEEAAKLNEQKYGQSTFELESARTEVQEAKLEAENLSIRLEEQTEAQKVLRDNLKAQLDTNSELTAQLQDSQATVKRLADEVCERESALKVTTAELMETKTKRSNGNSPSIKNRTAQTSVRTSLGTPGANCHRDGVEGHLIGEDLGSQTQAHVRTLFLEFLPYQVSTFWSRSS